MINFSLDHGHCHGTLPTNMNLLRMDVGIHAHPKYEPYSFKEISEIMSSHNFVPVDHHT